jgi:hypothetical protein
MPKSEEIKDKYAKINGISSAGAKKRLESGKEPFIIIDGVKYVVN